MKEGTPLRKKSASLDAFTLINALTPAEKGQLTAYSDSYAPDALRTRYINFHYGKPAYDQMAEEVEFKECSNLGSLKYDTVKWILKTMRKLNLRVHRLSDLIGMIDVAESMCIHKEALKLLDIAKKIAREEELIHWMPILMEKERKIAKTSLVGRMRLKVLRRIDHEYSIALSQLQHNEAIERISTEYFEQLKAEAFEFGRGRQIIDAFNENRPLEGLKNNNTVKQRLQILRIEEYFLGKDNNRVDARKKAEEGLALYRNNQQILKTNQAEHSKLLMALAIFYALEGNSAKAESILAEFQQCYAELPSSNSPYLGNYVLALFHTAFRFGEFDKAETAVKLVNQWIGQLNTIFVNDLLVSLSMGSYLIGVGKLQQAAFWNNRLLQKGTNGMRTVHRLQACILHLQVLYDKKDEEGLIHFGSNYSRSSRKYAQEFRSACQTIRFLKSLGTSSRKDLSWKLGKHLQVLDQNNKNPTQTGKFWDLAFELWAAEKCAT